MLRFFTFTIFLLLSYCCWGQTIKGRLVTEEVEPINFALVSLHNLSNGHLKAQVFPSDEGVFTFGAIEAGSYRVHVEGGLGFDMYESDSLVIKDDPAQIYDLGDIVLKYTVYETDVALVTADSIKPMLEYDIDKMTMNIEGTSLGTLPSLSTLLELAPNVSQVGGVVSIAGKSNVLILINGKRTNLKLENIPPNIIESIEIISNPSAEYDANVGAVLNINLKKGSMEGIQGNVYAKYTQGIYPRFDAGSLINFNKKKFTAQLSIDYSYYKIRSVSIADRRFEATQPFYYSGSELKQESEEHSLNTNLSLGWSFNPNHDITLSGEYSYFNAPNNSTSQQDVFSSTLEAIDIDSTLDNTTTFKSIGNNFQAQLSYNGKFGKHWSIASELSYLYITPSNNSDFSFQLSNINNPAQNSVVNYHMNDSTQAGLLIGQLDLSWNKKSNTIDFGAKYTNINTYYSIAFENNNIQFTGNSNWFRYNEGIYAAYLQWKSSIGKFQWRLGLRGEYATTKGIDRQNLQTNIGQFNYFPSAALLFTLSQDHIFKLAYNKSIERVSFFDRSPYVYYTGLYTKFEGNPNLRPQISHSVSLEYFLMGRFSFQLYYNEVIDYINQVSELNGSLEAFRSINFQNSNYGLSVGGQFKPLNWWTISYNLAGAGAYTRGEAQNQPFNTWTAYVYLGLYQSFNLWNWMKVDAIVSYTSPYAVGIYSAGHLFFLDLNLSKNFFKDQLTVSIYLSDLFGTRLQQNGVDFNAQQRTVVHNRDVRTVTLSLIYNFSKGRKKEVEPINTIDDNTVDRLLKN